jgi:nucleoside-diphosphate-sugar epimerase
MNVISEQYRNLLLPSDDLINDLAGIEGDILILGAGGKMGPALARLAVQAIHLSGVPRRVIAVSRFSETGLAEQLQSEGIETIAMDLLDDESLQSLPEVENVIYMAGQKFGTTGKEWFTWAMNVYLPGRVAEKFKNSRIVVFSTGNVYPLSAVLGGGLTEIESPDPVGEYAQSCLGRERMFQYAASKYQTPLFIFRLNYAIDVSYGVLLEIAKAVKTQKAIDLNTGHVNVIWQGDANEMALRALQHCGYPAKIVNITGPETLSVRWAAGEFGRIFQQEPVFVGTEQPTALLSNAAESFRLFGYPKITLKAMIELLAGWLEAGGKTKDKPTHFQERKGNF